MKITTPLLKRSHALLIAAAVIVPVILFVGAALKSREDVFREGEDEVTRSIADIGDNVHVVLDTERRTLTSVDDHIHGMTWEDVAKPDTSLFLRTLASGMEGIGTIWIADPDGYIKAASEPLDRGARVPEKEFFATRHQDDADYYLSTVIEGTPPRIVSIDMVRRRLTLSGASNGSIHAALNAAYFVHLFQTAAPLADDVVLVRGDGEVLADSHSTNHYLTPTTPLMQNVAEYPAGRMFADREELYSYLQVPGFPVHIGLAVSKSAILRRWYEGLVVYSVAAFAASLALLGVSWMAIRSAKSEHMALVALNTETEKRLEAERRLHATQRMEAVGQLAAGIARNFNNLLAGILGNLELLMNAKDQERIHQLTERARRAGERGAHLVSTLLTFVGKQALHAQTVNLNALLSDFVPLIEQSMGEAIPVELVLDPTLQDCRADLGQLKAALLNLAVNARDAMVSGGTLTVATKNASQWMAVTFRDTGSGMTEDVKARIFEPFFTTKGVGEGSGLGLSQVLGFVQQVGGHVTVDSDIGLGTTVTLYFPQLQHGALIQSGRAGYG